MNSSIPDRLMSVRQRVNSVSAHPALIVEIDECQLDLTQRVNLVHERPQCLRLDEGSLAVKDALPIAVVRQLLLDSRLADAFAFHRVATVRANTVALRAQADDAVDRLTIAFVLHLADDLFIARAQLGNVLVGHAVEDGMR